MQVNGRKFKKKLKKPKTIDCSRCKFKCSINFDKRYRNYVCNKCWSLPYVQKENVEVYET